MGDEKKAGTAATDEGSEEVLAATAMAGMDTAVAPRMNNNMMNGTDFSRPTLPPFGRLDGPESGHYFHGNFGHPGSYLYHIPLVRFLRNMP